MSSGRRMRLGSGGCGKKGKRLVPDVLLPLAIPHDQVICPVPLSLPPFDIFRAVTDALFSRVALSASSIDVAWSVLAFALTQVGKQLTLQLSPRASADSEVYIFVAHMAFRAG